MIDPTKTYQTRDGRKVLRILCTDAPGTHPVVALVEVLGWGDTARAIHYTADGRLTVPSSVMHGWDLIEVPKKYEGWVNIYGTDLSGPMIGHTIHPSREAAVELSGTMPTIACLHISFTEGEGLTRETR